MPILGAYMVPHPPMIVPAVGRGSEKQVEATTRAYEQVAQEIAALAPDTIILTSPHATMYADYLHISPGRSAKGDFGRFNARQERYQVDYDEDLTALITKLAREKGFPAGTMGERDKSLDHGTMVPLYFIREAYPAVDSVKRVPAGDSSSTRQGVLGGMFARAGASGAAPVRSAARTGLGARMAEQAVYGERQDSRGGMGEKGGHGPDDAASGGTANVASGGTANAASGGAADEAGSKPAVCKIVRIGLSGLPLTEHYKLGQMIREAVEILGRRAVFVASGDLSHKLQDYGPYGFAAEGPQYDERIMDVCSRAAFGELFDFEESFCEKAAECGHRSFVIMAGAFDGLAVKATQLSHEDVTGVGYGICTFYPGEPDEGRHFLAQYLVRAQEKLSAARAQEDPYVQLARKTVEMYVRDRVRPEVPQDLPPEMLQTRAGAFVSIHEHGKLRGCIGTIAPVRSSVAQEIIDNAVSASTRDPRFDPITADELEWLEISVDVLGAAEPIESPAQLDVKRYGVIVTKGTKRGLLLPDLDGVDTVEEQIAIAKRKASISEWDKNVQLERFEVVRHH